MKLLRDVVCQMGKGYGYPLLSATIVESTGFVPLAKKAPTQTITTDPWGPQQEYLRQIFRLANQQMGSDAAYKFFPGQTYASFSPQTENALNLTEQRAMAGSPVQQTANQELQRTLGGEYLHGGSGFDAAFQAAANKIIPDVESRFNRGGRFGSGLARQAETSALADAFASQYANERENQLRAMFFAPQAAEADYNDLARLAGVGQAREGQTQSAIDEAMARHEFEQSEYNNRLARYLAMIQGNYGETETKTGFGGNKGAGILGGALAGGIGGAQATGGNPWGAGAGAALGGLAGLF